MAATLGCPHCRALLELPDVLSNAPAKCPMCRKIFALPGMGADAETNIRAGPPPAVTFTADPLLLNKAAIPEIDWRYFPGVVGEEGIAPEGRKIQAHRGGEILLYGVLALLPLTGNLFVFGILAITRAEHDLREINRGRIDPAGENFTRFGRLLGYVGVFFWTLVTLLFCISTPNRF